MLRFLIPKIVFLSVSFKTTSKLATIPSVYGGQ